MKKTKRTLWLSIIAIALCALMLGGIIAVSYDALSDNEDEIIPSVDNENNLPVVKPKEEIDNSASASVEVTEDNKTVADVELESEDGEISASIPSGTLLDEGVSKVTLTVEKIDNSEANIEIKDNEATVSYNVHIEGVSSDNKTPIKVYVKELLPVGLNMGNYKFYHVENGATVEMTLFGDGEPVHNNFEYDSTTGDCVLYLASFSEIAVVNDTVNAWEGNFDYVFKLENDNTYIISTADELAGLGAIVGGMNNQTRNSFAGKTIKLIADINLGDKDNANGSLIFHPIGYYYTDDNNGDGAKGDYYSTVKSFEGTFDGNGHTIANFYQNTWEIKGDYEGNYYSDAMGLFGYVVNGTVKNLTVNNFSSDGEFTPTGVIAAYAVNSTFENIAITECNPRVYNTGNGGIVGIGGNSDDPDTYKLTFTNITIDNSNKISALWGSWDVACGGLVGMFRGAGHAYMTNCHVAAQIDVYNDVCGNYQYYWYRYAGMMIGTNKNMITDDKGYTVPETTKFHAEDCTVHFGDWNEYWYCELVANSIASYTHDHQFSRLEQIASLDEIKNGSEWTKTGNFLLISGDTKTCYHIVKNDEGELVQHLHTDAGEETVNGETVLKEDKTIVYLPFNQLFTGYGWGVKHIPVYNGEDYAFDGITILDREVADSKIKFDKAETAKDSYTTKTSVTIGELFKAATGVDVDILGANVQVTVSPVGENSTAGGTYVPNADDWTQGTLTFTGVGEATITITDYYYCTPTTINVVIEDKQPVDKFKANSNLAFEHKLENDTITVSLGDIFSAIEGAEINSTNVKVTIDNEALCTYVKNENDWTKSTLAFTGLGTVTISITDENYCNTANAVVTISNPATRDFTVKFPNTADYVYRVGNANSIKLSSLFEADIPDNATINGTFNTISGDANGSITNATWANGTIQFTGTGVVTITIDSDAFTNAKALTVEVVNATNVTTYSELKEQNSVLLANITMSSGGTYRLTGNKSLYGNGFTFDVRSGAYAGVNYDYASYVIYIENSRLDNVKIEGAVYPEVGATKSDNYNRAIVMSSGNCLITNSYISNGASPIRNGGNLELINTTLKGGIYANLDLRNGHLILDNVTTINQVGANDKYNDSTEIVGMGIVIYQEGGSDSLKITIRNSLTQYNYLSKTQADELFTGTYNKAIKNVVFGGDFSDYQNNGWINFGIISMNNYFTENNLTDERTDTAGYFGTAKTVSLLGASRNCYVYSLKPIDTAAPLYPGYTTAGQGIIAPTTSFDFTEKNYVQKGEGNDHCYAEGKTVYISMDEGDTFNWDSSILTATKYGEVLSYTVTMNGIDYTGKTITFNTSNTYTVVYSYTDSYNYMLKDDKVVSFDKTYTEAITITVSVVKPEAKNAVFSFGANGTAYSAKVTIIGDKTYVMPDVTATVSGKIGSTTVSGTTVYYPITEMYTSDGTTAHTGSWYACFPIFKDALQIIDYADKGTGDPVTYNQTNVTTVDGIPSTLKATNPTSAFLYSMNATNYPPPTDPTAVSGAVCYTCNRNGLTSGNTRDDMTIIAEYTYTNNAGKVYYYYIGYHCAAQTKGSTTPCITPDTLITLADGTQARVDSLTGNEELLVWNHETGKLDTAPIAYIVNHDKVASEREIIHLYFSDGSEIKIIGEHVFYDATLNKYVAIDGFNAEEYVGHKFLGLGDNTVNEVQLVSVERTVEETEVYEIVSYKNLTCFTNGILSTSAYLDKLLNIFDIDTDTYAYNAESVQKDIEEYGLYTYADFENLISEEAFELYNAKYLKIAVGKGYITWDDILDLIDIYFNVDVQPIQ